MPTPTVISPQEWKLAYETALESKGLLEWVLSTTDQPYAGDPALAGEDIPSPTNDPKGHARWVLDWTIVRNTIEQSLGEVSRALVRGHVLYKRIEREGDERCRTIRRVVIIRQILEDKEKLATQAEAGGGIFPSPFGTVPVPSSLPANVSTSTSTNTRTIHSSPTKRGRPPLSQGTPAKRKFLVSLSPSPTPPTAPPMNPNPKPDPISNPGPNLNPGSDAEKSNRYILTPRFRTTQSQVQPSPIPLPIPGSRIVRPKPKSQPRLGGGYMSKRDIQRAAIKAKVLPDTWGTRCIRCGHMSITLPDGRILECKARTFDVVVTSTPGSLALGVGAEDGNREGEGEGGEDTETGTIITQYIEKGGKHLLITSGPKAGSKLCATWNWSRTLDGQCPIKGCMFTHWCSLCFGTKHRAMDCEVREYLPLPLPECRGRPRGLVPADVDECFAQSLGLPMHTPKLELEESHQLELEYGIATPATMPLPSPTSRSTL